MTTFKFDKSWDKIVAKLKQRYGQLADDDLTFAEGKGEELLTRLRERLEISEEELDNVLNEFRDDITTKFQHAKEKVVDLADDVRTKAAAAADRIKTQAEAAYDRTRTEARSLHERGEKLVRERPIQSVAVALLVGVIVGMMIHDQ